MISVLIPCFNRIDTVGQTIQSALNQTVTDIEVVVVDNGSTDGSYELALAVSDQDQRVRVFRNESNIGPVRNWQRCLDEARGYYATFLWSDDVWHPEFLQQTSPILDQHADVGFVVTQYQYFSDVPFDLGHGPHFGAGGIFQVDQFLLSSYSGEPSPVSPAHALFRLADLRAGLMIDVPNRVGSAFSQHGIGPDLLLYLHTCRRYPSYAVVDKVLAFFRIHDGAISVAAGEKSLTLHYNLAKAYFAETHYPALIRLHNSQIFLSLIGCHLRHQYGLSDISCFYTTNQDFRLDYPAVIRRILKKIKMDFMPKNRR